MGEKMNNSIVSYTDDGEWLVKFDVGGTIDWILRATGSYGCSAAADTFPNASSTIGPNVDVSEGVEAAIEIAAGAQIFGIVT